MTNWSLHVERPVFNSQQGRIPLAGCKVEWMCHDHVACSWIALQVAFLGFSLCITRWRA